MKRLYNDNWKFLKSPVGTAFEEAKERLGDFINVEIPHDFLIEDAHNLYADATGWYLNHFEAVEGRRLFFVFDGIYMDSVVYINGKMAGEWKSGYSQFVLDVTDFVIPGTNEIMVAARCRYPSARWYTGAGIYRNVWLCDYGDVYIPENGIYVHSEKVNEGYLLEISTEVLGSKTFSLTYNLTDANGREMELTPYGDSENTASNRHEAPGKTIVTEKYLVWKPAEWDVSSPTLHTLQVDLRDYAEHEDYRDRMPSADIIARAVNTSIHQGMILQSESIRFGFRNLHFDANKGFFINERHMKINGVCLHHDLGALGVAFNRSAMKRRLVQLKEMGVNALRLSHNVYDPAVLELADEMGFLVDSEALDMWERPKTEYDFSHCFTDWYEREVESWVRRDRNHPSVFMWSIGNEIHDTHADERGLELTKILRDEVKKHDPLGNGLVTSASNFMPWANAQKCADELELVGYNYAERCYKEHHEAHPDWIIYGSETYSIVQSRGIYHFPLSETVLSDSDLQCSSLGNSSTSWGAESIEACICDDRDMEFSLGQFIWTGYDYIGEPTPYQTKNSYFGLIDTAGFYKDAYYIFKSAWVSSQVDPFVHIFPYWDFNEGQLVDVRVASNLPFVELFLNGRSLGKQELTHAPGSGHHIVADYSVVYEKGELKAVAYDENGKMAAEAIKKSFGDTKALKVDIFNSDNEKADSSADLLFAEISAVAAAGNPVENANDYVKVSVDGGTLVGFDNGDSTDYDSYKADTRRLFSGKALAIVKPDKSGSMPVITASLLPGRDIRSIKLNTSGTTLLTPARKNLDVTAEVLPAGADTSDLRFRVLNKKGVDTNIAKVTQDGTTAHIEALGDGEFRLRAEANNGAAEVKAISEMYFTISGIGTAFLDPFGYISASLFSSSSGEINAGNEQGIASARDKEAVVTFDGIDFGRDGSDEITVDIFALTDEACVFEIWKGVPGEEDSVLLADRPYHKKMIWSVYQPDTWQLSERLTGICTISFRVYEKMHIKGFSFKKQERAWYDILAVDADSVYGDAFTKTTDAVEGIGNNVTLTFGEINFGTSPTAVVINGRSNKVANTLHMIFKDPETGKEEKEILEFEESADYTTKEFPISRRTGTWEVSFVFLPGSNFDFKAFKFL